MDRQDPGRQRRPGRDAAGHGAAAARRPHGQPGGGRGWYRLPGERRGAVRQRHCLRDGRRDDGRLMALVTDRRRLGATAVEVTALSLGTAPIAGLFQPVGEEQAIATIERAWDLGLRFFDTAPLYGLGLAELRLGAALADKRRNDYVVATKVGRLLRPGTSGELAD